jgi:opacity protein-like surface antigen
MMRKLIGVAVLVLLVSAIAVAQEFPKAEIFGGYQYTHQGDLGQFGQGSGLNGWNAAVTGNLKHWIGVTGDFSGQYKSISGVDIHNYTYTFGPTLAARQIRTFTPFVHGLFGGFNQSFSGFGASATGSGFAMAIGGGMDASVKQHWAVRLGQFDWMSFRSNGSSSNNNFRYSAGLVLKF